MFFNFFGQLNIKDFVKDLRARLFFFNQKSSTGLTYTKKEKHLSDLLWMIFAF